MCNLGVCRCETERQTETERGFGEVTLTLSSFRYRDSANALTPSGCYWGWGAVTMATGKVITNTFLILMFQP